MRPAVIAVQGTNNMQKTVPYVYISNTWVPCVPYVHNGEDWEPVGQKGTLFLTLRDSEGNEILGSNDRRFLVKQD